MSLASITTWPSAWVRVTRGKCRAAELAAYVWSGRTIKYHARRSATSAGPARWPARTSSGWSSGSPASCAHSSCRSIAYARTCSPRFRDDRIESLGSSRIERSLDASLFERRFTHGIIERLSAMATEWLEQLLTAEQDGVLAEMRSDPEKSGLNTILEKVDELERVRGLGLPVDLFADCSEKLIAAWRARAAVAYPSDLRAMPRPVYLNAMVRVSRWW